MKLRRMYYWLAALLYNLWIILRQILGGLKSCEFKDVLFFELKDALPVSVNAGPDPPL